VIKIGLSRMDSKGQWEYGIKQCVSYGWNAFRLRERGMEEQKKVETYNELDRAKVNVIWPDDKREDSVEER
jgi:hypothetical protein